MPILQINKMPIEVSSTETWNKALLGLTLTRTASYSKFMLRADQRMDSLALGDVFLDSKVVMADTLAKLPLEARRMNGDFKRLTNRIITNATDSKWSSGTSVVTVHDLVVYDSEDAFDESYEDRDAALEFQRIVKMADICVLDAENAFVQYDPYTVYVGTVPELVEAMLSWQNHDVCIACLRPYQSKMLQQMTFCLSGLLTEALVDGAGKIEQRSVTIYAVGGPERWIYDEVKDVDCVPSPHMSWKATDPNPVRPAPDGLYLGLRDTPEVELKQPVATTMGWQEAQCDSVEIVLHGLYLGIEVASPHPELTQLYRSVGLNRSPNNYSVLIHDSVGSYLTGSTEMPEVHHLLWDSDAAGPVPGIPDRAVIHPRREDSTYLKKRLLEYSDVLGEDLFVTTACVRGNMASQPVENRRGRLLTVTVPNVHYDKAMTSVVTDLIRDVADHCCSGSDKVRVKALVLSDHPQLTDLEGVLCEKADVLSVDFVGATGLLYVRGPAETCVEHLLLLRQKPILLATNKDEATYAANVCDLLSRVRVDCPFGTVVMPVFVLSDKRGLEHFMDEIKKTGVYVTVTTYDRNGSLDASALMPRSLLEWAVVDTIAEALKTEPRLKRYLCFRDPAANTYEWNHIQKHNIHPAIIMLMFMIAHRLYEPGNRYCFGHIMDAFCMSCPAKANKYMY